MIVEVCIFANCIEVYTHFEKLASIRSVRLATVSDRAEMLAYLEAVEPYDKGVLSGRNYYRLDLDEVEDVHFRLRWF